MVWLACAFIILSLLGVPVAFSLFISTTGYAILSGLLPPLSVASTIINGMGNFLLVAIPAYILMAELMNRSSITEKIFNFAHSLVGHFTGGLAHVNVVASLIFAGMSGSQMADIAGLGRIEVKLMEEQGFPRDFASAVTVASATLGPVLPPSIIMVIFAALAEVSIGRMFMGGVVPAFLIATALIITIFFICRRHKDWGKKAHFSWKQRLSNFIQAIPAIMTPLILLFGTVSGYWTPTEAGAAAVIYAFIVAKFWYKDLTWKSLFFAFNRTANASGNILLIFAAAHVFSRILALEGGPAVITASMREFTENPYVILLLINIVFFIGGMFVEPTPFLLIATPILMEISAVYHLDLVHLGVVSVVNLMLGTITPPFAIGLFTISEAVDVPFHHLIRASLPFYIPFLIVLLFITYIPAIILWLPNMIMG